MRTRLELLVAGIEETDTLGPSLTPIEQWQEIAPADLGERNSFYQELLPSLRDRGFDQLCRVLEEKLEIYGKQAQVRMMGACSPSLCSALDGGLYSDQDKLVQDQPWRS